VQDNKTKNMMSEIIGSFVSTKSLTNEALVATEREIVTLKNRPDLTDDEADILSALLESVKMEYDQRTV